jgi:hypothetical protein
MLVDAEELRLLLPHAIFVAIILVRFFQRTSAVVGARRCAAAAELRRRSKWQ